MRGLSINATNVSIAKTVDNDDEFEDEIDKFKNHNFGPKKFKPHNYTNSKAEPI
ncbi:15122_t:CDS:2 [Funneliformis caledonium]|uniref:15122_t:CDS:1 n=1 Tax=Funneliformis caledonium TaxID=1117310 RepID=A0A9N9NDL0_9GLOM|nr:15122_t:CDS:2 [Funneliformis caledonium]